jgi:NAD(P)-dependent dehydrogenase (short-subunit alcohol dehydrogenase family)
MTGPAAFAGRSAIVTGAGGGMGLDVALHLARCGAEVTAVDVKDAPAELPPEVHYVRGDVTDPAFAPEVVGAVAGRSASGNVDMLVNAVGVAWFDQPGVPTPPMLDTSIVDIDLATWHRVLDINLTGPMLFSREALKVMREARRGALVHISSVGALRHSDGIDAYQVSKAGLLSLSRAIAAQFGRFGIRSNTVCPGTIVTPMTAGMYEHDPARKDRVAAGTPLRRLGTTADVRAAIAYLLSDDASFVTGVDLAVDGGVLLNLG